MSVQSSTRVRHVACCPDVAVFSGLALTCAHYAMNRENGATDGNTATSGTRRQSQDTAESHAHVRCNHWFTTWLRNSLCQGANAPGCVLSIFPGFFASSFPYSSEV